MAGARIHVVEDEPVVAAGIARKLEHVGFSLYGTTLSGEAALRAVDSNPPDLVLMDIKLQGEIDGIDAAIAIKERYDIPVIFLTAYADEATLQRAKLAQPYGYLVKPFTDLELSGALEIALHRHEIDVQVRRREAQLSAINRVVSGFAFSILLAPQPADDRLEWSIGSLSDVFGEVDVDYSSLLDILFAVHPDDAAALTEFAHELRGGGSGAIEFRIVTDTAQTQWVKLDARYETKRSGRIRRIFGSFQLVTPLRAALQKPYNESVSLDSVVHEVAQGVWVGQRDGRCVYANEALCSLAGLGRDEIVGHQSLQTLLGDRDTGEARFDAELIRSDRRRVPVFVTRSTVGDELDVYLIVDMTNRENERNEIESARLILEEAFRAGPIPSLIVDSITHAVLAANDAFCNVTGFSQAELESAGWFGLADYRELDQLNQMISLVAERDGDPGTLRIRTRAGGQVEFAVEVRDVVAGDSASVLLLLEETGS